MKKRVVGIASLCCLFVFYYVCRYLLFGWHGMKSFPGYLLVVGIIAVGISGIIIGGKFAPSFTAAGYLAGFFIGEIFEEDSFDPGGGLINNMWEIWTITFLAAIFAGVLVEIFCKIFQKKHTAQ